MKNLSALSDEVLLEVTKDLACREREATLSILHHLLEVERRQLFARRGFSSLFEYAVKELNYSEGAAHRRISSMRLLKVLPEIETKIASAALPLSTLSQAQSFFRREEITAPQDKLELLARLEGKSAREVEKQLVLESSSKEVIKAERIRPISPSHHHLGLTIENELLEKIEELKALLSHRNPNMGTKELLAFAIEECLQKHRVKSPKVKVEESILSEARKTDSKTMAPSGEPGDKSKIPTLEVKTKNTAPALEVETANELSLNKKDVGANRLTKYKSRYISHEIKRRVWQRDRGQCTYVDDESGRRCSSLRFIEFDHIKPFAMRGRATEENLRLRCSVHNRLAAVDIFGRKKMEAFVAKMR